MRNNISGAQAYRNALRQQYQQQVNAAVQQIASQRAAGQQAMGNTYQQLKPTVQDNLAGLPVLLTHTIKISNPNWKPSRKQNRPLKRHGLRRL